jgi:hypothetical protein
MNPRNSPVHLTSPKAVAIPWLRIVFCSFAAGIVEILQNLNVLTGLTPNIATMLMVLCMMPLFFTKPQPASKVSASMGSRFPAVSAIPLGLAFANVALTLAMLTWLLFLRGPSSARYGFDVQRLSTTTDLLMNISLIIGLALTGTGFLTWRDWRNRDHSQRLLQRVCFSTLIFVALGWLLIVLAFCIPSIFQDIISLLPPKVI